MSETPQLTDRKALMMHRARAKPHALFLHEEALADVQDRLAMVNRTFNSTAIVTPFAEVWRPAFPDALYVADTDILGLEEATQDLVIHALALHWANDPVGQLIQCRRALKPDGLLLVVALGGQTLHELRAAFAQAEADITGGLSPRVAPMAEIRDLGALMQRSGLALPVADSATLTTTYASPLHLLHDLRAMGETNALAGRIRSITRRDVLFRMTQIYADTFAGNDGRVAATFDLITLTGWSPDASQPQPLRPGSASQRLADALNTTETSLKD